MSKITAVINEDRVTRYEQAHPIEIRVAFTTSIQRFAMDIQSARELRDSLDAIITEYEQRYTTV